MSTSRLADHRIRAATSQVVGLDVRGPVSRALGQIPVPLAEAPDDTPASPASVPPPTPSPRRTGASARRVLKPFEEAPWPTRAPKTDPKAALSGLTADERRVHRILLDTLVIQSEHGYGNGTGVVGLSYAEKQYLTVLDLAFIDAEIEKMDRGTTFSPKVLNLVMVAGAGLLGITAGALTLMGEGGAALSVVGIVAAVFFLVMPLLLIATTNTSSRPVATPRRKIYAALRELALLVDDAPVSDALQQADAVIDRLAANDDGPRLRLDDSPTANTSGPALRARTRS